MTNNEIANKVAEKLYRPNLDDIDYATQLLIEKLIIPESILTYTKDVVEKLILEELDKKDPLIFYADNKPLIEAINAIREDTDYNQWFTDGVYWIICKYDEISIGFIDQQHCASWSEFPHKATIKELIKKFT